jgi:hypothetical protein
MTITAWVYLDSSSPLAGRRDSRILAKMGGGGSRSWSSGIETNQGIPGQAAIQISTDGSDIVALNDSSALPVDQWVHYAGVYTPGTSMEIYLDGDLSSVKTSGIPESQFGDNGQPVLIGGRSACSCGWYGSLDEVRLYDEALTESEIKDLMGPTTMPGDFDGDDDVDGNDFLWWQRGELSDPPSASDLTIWEENFGAVGAASSAATSAVPEPSTVVLLALGFVGLLASRRGSC